MECERCNSDGARKWPHPGHHGEQTENLCRNCYEEMRDYYEYAFERFGRMLTD